MWGKIVYEKLKEEIKCESIFCIVKCLEGRNLMEWINNIKNVKKDVVERIVYERNNGEGLGCEFCWKGYNGEGLSCEFCWRGYNGEGLSVVPFTCRRLKDKN